MERIRLFLLLFPAWCATSVFAQQEFTTCLYDAVRERRIPVAVYHPKKETPHTRVILFSHGYDGNKHPHSNRTYAYLCRFLSEKGFYVISIQHELPGDPLLAMEGDFIKTRMPNWKRGEENILFTMREFKKLKPRLRWDKLILIGHSNGGDMTMLTAKDHPETIDKAISLDHRRMPMPRSGKPRLYTLRGYDYEADQGVLPDKKEQENYNITVLRTADITHSQMGEQGSDEQHRSINRIIYNWVK